MCITPYIHQKSKQSGSIFTVLLGGIVMAAALSLVVYQTLSGPLSSMVRTTKKTSSEVQARNAVNTLAIDTINTFGDCDSDGTLEPRPWRVATGGAGTFPPSGGLIPNDIGVQMTDYWGTDFGYCIWDAGSKSHDVSCNGDGTHNSRRLTGTTDVGVGTPGSLTSIAVISAGPDRTFNTSCRNYVNTTTDVVYATVGGAAGAGGDDIVERRSYAQMLAQTSDLWMLKVSDPATAVIDKSLEIGTLGSPQVTVTPSSGLVATSGRVDAAGGTRPGNAIANGACVAGTVGLLRYSTTSSYIEACNGTSFFGPSIESLTDGRADDARLNVSLGQDAGKSLTTGIRSTAIGYEALYTTATVANNTAIGFKALRSNTSGAANTAVGSEALYSNTSGRDLSAIGYQALRSNTNGSYNVAIGNQALLANISGSYNVAAGDQAMTSHASGSYNTGVGINAFTGITNGTYNTAIGYNAGPLSDGLEYTTGIGYGVRVASSNTWVGGPAGTKQAIYERKKEGAAGFQYLENGETTVTTEVVTQYSRIFITANDLPGHPSPGVLYVDSRTPGHDFTVKSTDANDSAGFAWEIKEPNCIDDLPWPDGGCNY